MRPAQKAPENGSESIHRRRLHGSFNEAGAKSAGKHMPLSRRPADALGASMRPAQKAPENPEVWKAANPGGVASMRPAQKAPENLIDIVCSRCGGWLQ